MSNKYSGAIAVWCFTAMLAFLAMFVTYNLGKNDARIETGSPVYHLSAMPVETPVMALYQDGGIITLVTARKLEDGRILPYNVYGGMVPYDLLDDPIGWTEIPEGLMEVLQ